MNEKIDTIISKALDQLDEQLEVIKSPHFKASKVQNLLLIIDQMADLRGRISHSR